MLGIGTPQCIAILCCSMIGLLCGCGGGAPASPQDSLEQDSSVFSGLSSVEKQSDGSWLLSWSAIANSQALYGIYISESESEMNFTAAMASTKESSFRYKPENLLAEGNRCFAVRIMETADSNTKVLCNNSTPAHFDGLARITPLNDASYLLRWSKLSVDDAVYWIFERDSTGEYDFSSPSYQQKSDFYKTSVTPRGLSKCYVVRVVHPSYGEDTNSKELCTELEEEIEFDFNGNVPIVEDSNEDGNRLVKWMPSATKGVVGYKVFLDNRCSLAATCLGGVSQVSGPECTLTNLQGKQYEVCVVAVDSAGRESLPILSNPFNHD